MNEKEFDEIEDIFDEEIPEVYNEDIVEEQQNEQTLESAETEYSEAVVEPVDAEYPEAVVEPVEAEYPEAVVEPVEAEYPEAVSEEVQTVYPEAASDEFEVPHIDVEDKSINDSQYNEFGEHPSGKIVLNNSSEEEKEEVKPSDLEPIKLSDNKSLMFVLLIGLIIFIAIMLLPKFAY